MQSTEWRCLQASIINALRIYGVRGLSERKVAEACGCLETSAGSNEDDALRGLDGLGFRGEPFGANDIGTAWAWLRGHLLAGAPVILCLDEWDHWTTAIGLCGDRVLVFDPYRRSSARSRRREYEPRPYTKRRLVERWSHSTARDERLYGIAVLKRTADSQGLA